MVEKKGFLKTVWGKILTILAAVLTLAAGYGTIIKVDAHYAKDRDLKVLDGAVIKNHEALQTDLAALKKRIDLDILYDRAARLRQRIWALTDRLGEASGNARDIIKGEIRELKGELERLKDKIRHAESQ